METGTTACYRKSRSDQLIFARSLSGDTPECELAIQLLNAGGLDCPKAKERCDKNRAAKACSDEEKLCSKTTKLGERARLSFVRGLSDICRNAPREGFATLGQAMIVLRGQDRPNAAWIAPGTSYHALVECIDQLLAQEKPPSSLHDSWVALFDRGGGKDALKAGKWRCPAAPAEPPGGPKPAPPPALSHEAPPPAPQTIASDGETSLPGPLDPTTPTATTEVTAPSNTASLVLYGIGGAAVVVGGVAAVVGFVFRNKANGHAEAFNAGAATADLESAYWDDRRTSERGYAIGAATAGSGVVVGIIGYVLWDGDDDDEVVAVSPWYTGDGAGLTARF